MKAEMKTEEIGILEARVTPLFSIEEIEKILECEKKHYSKPKLPTAKLI